MITYDKEGPWNLEVIMPEMVYEERQDSRHYQRGDEGTDADAVKW